MKSNVFVLLFLITLFLLPSPGYAASSGNTTIQSFNKSKKILLREVYTGHRETFYCGSEFDAQKQVFHTKGYIPQKTNKRSKRLEWEHVVPAHAFGQSFSEWRQGHPKCIDSKGKPFKGRKCAEKINTLYRYMQSDMHNLVPAIGEVNGLRSNYSFAMIPGEDREFGSCDMEIKNRKAEPPAEVRGDIARVYKYMDAAYPGRGVISRKNRKLFDLWDKEDPVDAWECLKNRKIMSIQGNGNAFVEHACSDVFLSSHGLKRTSPEDIN